MIRSLFDEALAIFLHAEKNLIIDDVNERTLCSRFAIVFESLKDRYELAAYYADADLNRQNGAQIKTIINGNAEVIVINADLVFHSRREILERDNLIAIEMKKSYRPEVEKQRDRQRLIAMTKATYDDLWSNDGVTLPAHVCGYELGAFIEINAAANSLRVEFFRDGMAAEIIEQPI